MLSRSVLGLIIILFVSAGINFEEFSQWRGPNRNGMYPEKGLLKKWPENGPDMLWSFEGIGAGHGNALMAYNLKDKKL